MKTLHVIFKTHLDVGFTDLAGVVTQRYMESFVPQAIERARELRDRGGRERFIWTTGSWLIYEYLERADAPRRREMEEAIAAGDIRWHGLPFTTHTEAMTPELFRAGLSLSQELDARFGVRTIAAKMTDVPGHTRSMIPLLAEAGIRFLHIGVNPASRAPDVPDLFRWREPGSESEVAVMYHKGSYGARMEVAGLDHAIYFAHTGDNCGPQSMAELLKEFKRLEEAFPGWSVKASSLDAFAAELLTVGESLPVIEAELGDNWIHGLGTDPAKVARFRTLCRLHRTWLSEGHEVDAFARRLLLIPEHTWGVDIKTHLGDYVNYPRDAFSAARARDRVDARLPEDLSCASVLLTKGERTYSRVESSWTEQRQYLAEAVARLQPGQAQEAENALAELTPVRPPLDGVVWMKPGETFLSTHFEVIVDGSGAISRLASRSSGRDLASGQGLGLLRYQSFSAADYERYLKSYSINLENPSVALWAVPDFAKPGLKPADSPSRFFIPKIKRLGRSTTGEGEVLLVELAFGDEEHRRLGAPEEAWIQYHFPNETPEVWITLQWFDKPANRMPEALWFSLCPAVSRPEAWTLDKLGAPVSPLDIIRDGNRNLHGIAGLLRHEDNGALITLESLDAALVAPGRPRLLEFDNTLPDLVGGMHFNLYNNIWGTNFPMWYEEDALFRFHLRLIPARGSASASDDNIPCGESAVMG